MAFFEASGSHNLIGDGSIFTNGIDGNIVGADPLFENIPFIDENSTGVNYNPANWDLRLKSGSIAINKGDNQRALDVGLDINSLDLAGNPRFVGIIDIGAYEFQSLL